MPRALLLPALPIVDDRLRASYQRRSPWPHLVIENVFDPDLMNNVEQEQQRRADGLRTHRSHREVKAETSIVEGDASSEVARALLGESFTQFLRRLTGIADLSPDPSHYLGGLHVGRTGSFTAVHRDFRVHPESQQFHRVNALLCLNSRWSEDWGGSLELWDREMSRAWTTITPISGRLVIFETTPDTLHGLPEPLRCPEGRARLSLATYFYSAQPPTSSGRPSRFWNPRRPQDPRRRSLPGSYEVRTELGRLKREAMRHIGRTRGSTPND